MKKGGRSSTLFVLFVVSRKAAKAREGAKKGFRLQSGLLPFTFRLLPSLRLGALRVFA